MRLRIVVRRTKHLRELARRVFQQAEEDDVAGLAAEIAFRTFLELFPFFIFVALIGSGLESSLRIPNPAKQMLQLLSDSLPQGAADPIRQQLESVLGSEQGLVGLPVLGVLWLAAGSGATLLKAMNRIYEVEETRPFWERYLVGLYLALLAGAVLLAAILLLSAGEYAGQQASNTNAPGWLWAIAGFVRWPILLIMLMIEAMVVYRVAQNRKPHWRFIMPGALLFAFGWLAASSLFVLYVDKAGGYSGTYGVLGGVVVLLLWLQITAYALVLGAELNDVLQHPSHAARAWERHGRAARNGHLETPTRVAR